MLDLSNRGEGNGCVCVGGVMLVEVVPCHKYQGIKHQQ